MWARADRSEFRIKISNVGVTCAGLTSFLGFALVKTPSIPVLGHAGS